MVGEVSSSADRATRIMLFVGHPTTVDHMATELGSHRYHAKMEPRDKEIELEAWKGGEGSNIMVTSPSLGNGINIQGVTHVYHTDGGLFSMLDYHQESGRAGRQGQPSLATTVVTTEQIRRRIAALAHPNDTKEQHALAHFLTTTACRQMAIASFLDPGLAPRDCQDLQGEW